MTMINDTTQTRNTTIETVDRLIDECPQTCADITLRFTTADGREIRVNARQFYGMLRNPYASMSWLSDVTMIRLMLRGSSKVISASAVPVVDAALEAEIAKLPALITTIRRGLAAQFAPAPDGVSVCRCGQPAEHTGGVCRDCHESAIDVALTQYEASYRQGAL